LGSLLGVVRLLYIPSTLFVHGDAAATARNIAAHEFLVRFSMVTYLLGSALWIFVTLALYRLLKGVDQTLALVMVILGSIMVTPLFFANIVNDAAALLFARGADFLAAFDKPQRDAMVALFLNLHHQLDLANEIFWGVWLIPLGLLVYRSRFLPRALGFWLIAGCFGYLAASFTGLIYPALEGNVSKWTQPVVLSEVAFMLWLIIMGAGGKRWIATSPQRADVAQTP
jgi:hypothetical protein